MMAKEATEMNGKVNDAECVIKIIHKNQKPKNFSLNFFLFTSESFKFYSWIALFAVCGIR